METAYSTVVKAGTNLLTCPKCGGSSKAEKKKPGVDNAMEMCPHCHTKIYTTYEPEPEEKRESRLKDRNASYLHLTESEQKELDELAKKTDDASLERFMELLKKEAVTSDGITWSEHALRESIKRMRPDYTPEQIEIFVRGR